MRKTLFHVKVSTAQGLQLQRQKGVALQRRLRDPVEYSFCQSLGQQMREAEIQAFEYHSVRSQELLVQFAAFNCGVLTSTPFDRVEVQVEASREAVGMRCLVDNRVHHFCIDPFLVDGVLPQRRCRGSDRVSDSDDVRTKELPGNDALDE